ncbi:MAG: hypothetical protein ACI8PZ_003500 [Myxococcota bacterium]
MVKLAIVGDIHGHWSNADTAWFGAADYDAVCVVGDLAGLRWSATLQMARALSALTVPTLLVPGNHDATHPAQLLAEMVGRPTYGDVLASVQRRRAAALEDAIAPHTIAAYSAHPIGHVTVIGGRPHSMGGPSLSFPGHLAAAWGVSSIQESAAKLCALVDAAPTDYLVFVAHNGPSGLGGRRSDIWGCDFRRDEGDWGDRDLAMAIDHARATGRRVLAVCAGHMHRRLRGGGERAWKVERAGTVYANAAVVPRIWSGARHHLDLRIDGSQVTIEDRWVGQ